MSVVHAGIQVRPGIPAREEGVLRPAVNGGVRFPGARARHGQMLASAGRLLRCSDPPVQTSPDRMRCPLLRRKALRF